MRTMLAVMMGMVLAGCHGSSTAEPEIYTATCEKGLPGSIPGGYAEHDFGTTDPGTLARVVAYSPANGTMGFPDGGQEAVTGHVLVPAFLGSVAIVECIPGEPVTFELLP